MPAVRQPLLRTSVCTCAVCAVDGGRRSGTGGRGPTASSRQGGGERSPRRAEGKSRRHPPPRAVAHLGSQFRALSPVVLSSTASIGARFLARGGLAHRERGGRTSAPVSDSGLRVCWPTRHDRPGRRLSPPWPAWPRLCRLGRITSSGTAGGRSCCASTGGADQRTTSNETEKPSARKDRQLSHVR